LTDKARDTAKGRSEAAGSDTPPTSPTQVKIVIPDDHSMVSLLGSRDELLAVIENSFDADVHVRGNEITVTGPPSETELASRLLDELIQMIAEGT
jgi:phosphate starvation-inducible PhoH-like protein